MDHITVATTGVYERTLLQLRITEVEHINELAVQQRYQLEVTLSRLLGYIAPPEQVSDGDPVSGDIHELETQLLMAQENLKKMGELINELTHM